MRILDRKIEEFYSQVDVEREALPTEDIVDPGAKSIKSLTDKVVRNIEMFNNPNYTLSKIGDMSICSILFDSYSEMPRFLMQLKEYIPEVTGYISRFNNGYRGVHLNFKIDGVNVEVQLSSRDAWAVNKATEPIYVKWRNFDKVKDFAEIVSLQSEIDSLINETDMKDMPIDMLETLAEKQQVLEDKRKAFKNNVSEQAREMNLCKDLYRELHEGVEKSDFHEFENQIESILYSFSVKDKSKGNVQHDFFNETFSTADGKANAEKIKAAAEKVNNLASQVQNNLIEKATKAKDISRASNNQPYSLEEGSLAFKLAEAGKVYDNLMAKKLPEAVRKEYANMIYYQRYNTVVGAFKHNEQNGGNLEKSAKEIVRDFIQDKIDSNEYEGSNVDIDFLVERIEKEENSKSDFVDMAR